MSISPNGVYVTTDGVSRPATDEEAEEFLRVSGKGAAPAVPKVARNRRARVAAIPADETNPLTGSDDPGVVV